MNRMLLASMLAWAIGVAPATAGEPLKVCLVSGSAEYESDTSLAAFKTHLEEEYQAQAVLLQAQGFAELPGLEALENCDVALFFTRRLTIDGEALEQVKKYCQSGKPVVAVRTASHGFQNWLEFDRQVLGGNYQGHFGDGPVATITVTNDAKQHPVLQGVADTIQSKYSLYRTARRRSQAARNRQLGPARCGAAGCFTHRSADWRISTTPTSAACSSTPSSGAPGGTSLARSQQRHNTVCLDHASCTTRASSS
jgi:Trehalose utilisation